MVAYGLRQGLFVYGALVNDLLSHAARRKDRRLIWKDSILLLIPASRTRQAAFLNLNVPAS
jgi:hypothetical protein